MREREREIKLEKNRIHIESDRIEEVRALGKGGRSHKLLFCMPIAAVKSST